MTDPAVESAMLATRLLSRGAILAVVCAVGAAYVGNFHFIYGSGISVQKVEKVSWSLSETVINVDEVKGLPLFAARMKYPLFLQAMEAMGMITPQR